MHYALVKDTLIPVRFAPSHKSEMTDQILFGEFFEIFDQQEEWSFIKNKFNNYTGWINNKHRYSVISEDLYRNIPDNSCKITTTPYSQVKNDSDSTTLVVPGGSVLPNFDRENSNFYIDKERFMLTSHSPVEVPGNNARKKILAFAEQYLHTPYLWGGKTIFGMDCSGFIQIIFRMMDIHISRDSSDQVTYGETVGFFEQAQPGDLIFFDDEEGNITHTGILMNSHEIIHASGRVRKDLIDHQGIYNRETRKYTHKLRIIKNFLKK